MISPTNSPDVDIECQAMDLLQRVAAFGFSMSKKVGKEEFIQMMNEGALDHQQAANEIMQLIEADVSRREQLLLDEYSWDSWSVGWGDDDKHRRQLVLIRGGKVAFKEVVVDGEFCRCEPYRHGWPTVNSCIVTWAKTQIAKRQPLKGEEL